MKNKLTNLINKSHYKNKEEPRNYIGASSIGHNCYRKIWYEFNGYVGQPITEKLERTLEIGKTLESLVIKWLSNAGLNISEVCPDLQSLNNPRFQGHVDAILCNDRGKPYAILEIKTAKDSSFNIFDKKGLQSWNKVYYAQVQSYMGMSGIHEAYIIVLNKDTSELCDEKVKFDQLYYNSLEEKATLIADAKIMPPKVNGSPLWFECKMCKFQKECHK